MSLACHGSVTWGPRGSSSGSLARYRGATESFAHGEDNPVRHAGDGDEVGLKARLVEGKI
jgi:hypothetical protein